MSNQKPDPRIAPKEMIVTRYKSAQRRMQLREKDRSMTKITELLKSPTSKPAKTRKRVKKASTTVKKVLLQDCGNNVYTEYCPDKLRRKFEEKRKFLRPKYQSKTVVKLNKRKLGIPRRGFHLEGDNASTASTDAQQAFPGYHRSRRSPSPGYAELSMAAVVRLVEDTDGLDDEDLMEILTCPSPVWWEDPPTGDYIEEAIFKRKANQPIKQKKSGKDIDEESNNVPIVKEIPPDITDDIEINNRDDRFLRKRSKLESLLGNIKNKSFKTKDTIGIAKPDHAEKDTERAESQEVIEKVTKVQNVIDKDKKVINEKDTKVLNDLEKDTKVPNDLEKDTNVPNDLEKDTNVPNDLEKDTKVPNDLDKDTKAQNDIEKDAVTVTNKDDTPVLALSSVNTSEDNEHSESIESLPDLCFVDDDLLNEFENMDIPVETAPNVEDKQAAEAQEKAGENLSTQVPNTLPPLVRRPKVDNTAPETDASSSPTDGTDTISDTNIKFISDEDVNAHTVRDMKVDRPSINTDILKAIQEKDFITVYKIVQSDVKEKSFADKLKDIPEYSSYVDKLTKQESVEDCAKYDGQLNSFFKKCKNVNRKKKLEKLAPEPDSRLCGTCEPKKSTIDIAQEDNVKYCLKCSSIFDTDECSYCIQSKSEKESDIAVDLT